MSDLTIEEVKAWLLEQIERLEEIGGESQALLGLNAHGFGQLTAHKNTLNAIERLETDRG